MAKFSDEEAMEWLEKFGEQNQLMPLSGGFITFVAILGSVYVTDYFITPNSNWSFLVVLVATIGILSQGAARIGSAFGEVFGLSIVKIMYRAFDT
jgi:UDP-N-acetylmuramyl pentapeptide phosphotransferase/UDP-N-acetylglucosamine-1-phosphate transferase